MAVRYRDLAPTSDTDRQSESQDNDQMFHLASYLEPATIRLALVLLSSTRTQSAPVRTVTARAHIPPWPHVRLAIHEGLRDGV